MLRSHGLAGDPDAPPLAATFRLSRVALTIERDDGTVTVPFARTEAIVELGAADGLDIVRLDTTADTSAVLHLEPSFRRGLAAQVDHSQQVAQAAVHPALRLLGAALLVLAGLLLVDLGVTYRRIERIDVSLPDVADERTNWLVIGSDSRAAAADMASADAFGSDAEVPGERADVILLVQQGQGGEPARLVSIPRDLLVFRQSRGVDRLALTLLDGPQSTVTSICRSLGIAVDHVVIVRFDGVRDVIDTLGGIEVRTDRALRDANTGLDLPVGQHRLSGEQAVAWVRSRHVQERVGDTWVDDPSGDAGRQRRQRELVALVAQGASSELWNPLRVQRLAWTTAGALATDRATTPQDLARLAWAVRGAQDLGSLPHLTTASTIPVAQLTSDAADVLDSLRDDGDGAPCPRARITD
ncbi:MAG: LCP family protein [Microthrixaceae bacterium]